MKGIAESWGEGWRPAGALARAAWFFRPRSYMIAWGLIVALFVVVGSPHLRIVYGPSGCSYAGLNGWVQRGTHDSFSQCPLVEMFRLPLFR